MKLTQTSAMKRKSGMTLLELTVVILVLLSLISILFIGARAWKRGSDRAGCILNIRNMQQAVRSYGNMNGVNPGSEVATITLTPGATNPIIGAGKFMENAPVCPTKSPTAGVYTLFAGVPAVGTVAMTCSLAASEEHAPTGTNDW
jgi:prepilin-type N-terminal cleavage/methylation domain-containing protein